MSGGNVGDETIEMDSLDWTTEDREDLGFAIAYQPTQEKNAVGPSYVDRFKSVLSDCDKTHTWWDAVEEFLKQDGDFADKVS